MSDPDLAQLGRTLDLSRHTDRKLPVDPNGPGVVRLDHFSGLFLERGERDGEWVLEARTWGDPAPEIVHGWRIVAALAARELDATVTLPEPLEHAPAGPSAPARRALLRRHHRARAR